MKKTIWLAALLSCMASAQTWETETGTLQLTGCYAKQDGVYCDFNFTLTKKQTASLRWFASGFKAFKPDGVAQTADGIAFVDGEFDEYGSNTHEIFAGIPVKLQLYFNIPSATAQFRAMDIGGKRFENIPIAQSGAPKPSTATTLPAGIGVTGFNIALSNCALQGQNYVCTATLTPTK